MTDYALRLSDDELARYRKMAEMALADEGDLWALAGIVPGARVADLGCGPGASLAAMAGIVGESGAVVGVDGDPEAVAAAHALIASVGLGNADAHVADVAATGLAPASFDVAVLRHVLAHNGPTEQAIVDHATSLLRPGGCVYVLDIEATMIRMRPVAPVLDEMWTRYTAFHAGRGNDLAVGLRLHELLERAGLEVVAHHLRGVVMDRPVGQRSPAWAARDAMVAAGHADAADLERWGAALTALDASPTQPRLFFPTLIGVGRRPRE